MNKVLINSELLPAKFLLMLSLTSIMFNSLICHLLYTIHLNIFIQNICISLNLEFVTTNTSCLKKPLSYSLFWI
jgi:hypothetical protein